MTMKYDVASRRMVSNRLGIPGYLVPNLLAVTKIAMNARTSKVRDTSCIRPRDVELHREYKSWGIPKAIA
jgi:hypothetical protein